MPETYKNINELLKPLEMRLEQNSCNTQFGFYHDKIGQLIAYVDSTIILDMPNLEYIIYCLFNATYFSISPFSNVNQFRCIENPYFGCKSLEEALIKLDLNVNGKNLEI